MARILIISHEFPPFIGGAGSVAESWIKSLSGTHEVTLITRFHPDRQRTGLNYRLEELKTKPVIFPIFYQLHLKKLMREGAGFDLILLNDLGAAHVGALFFDVELLAKTWVYFQGNEIEAVYQDKSLKGRLFLPRFKRLLKGVNTMLFASHFLKDKVLKQIDADLGLRGKAAVIHPSLDHQMFFPDHSLDKAALGIAAEDKVLLTVARLVEQKGLDQILSILQQLRSCGYNYHWIVVGNGPHETALRQQIDASGLAAHVTVLNAVMRNKLREFYTLADIFILLSEFEESFGLVYLEANACGTPVIGRNKGGVAEVIRDKETGYLVDNTEHALELLMHKDFTHIDKATCIRWSDDFSLAALQEHVSKLIQERFSKI